MSPPPARTVALVCPLWIGHHPMYFTQFAASFLRCGARVIGLCPEPDAARAALVRALDPEPSVRLGDLTHFAHITAGSRSFFKGRFEGDPVRTFQRWKTAAETVAAAEQASGMRADLVYFPYLDSYLRFLPFSAVPDAILRRPWSGLYLRNHHHGLSPSLGKSLKLLAKGDAIFLSRFCRGVGVLDERFIPPMEKLSGKRVTAYPDVTQGGLPEKPFPLAVEIQRRAAGRRIIGMIGIERRKGFLTLLRTAALARERRLPYFFVCAGASHLGEFTPDERAEIDAALQGIASGEIDNLHLDPAAGRIPDEADYNSLFSTFHIAWAAYEGFQGSSGTLGKAALFGIPCLASAGECIGSRVEAYRLGLTIPEASPHDALAAIPFLVNGADRDARPLLPRFEDYRRDHSQARLDRILGELLAG